MYKINYTLIGTIPEMEQYRDTLPSLLSRYERNAKNLLVPAKSQIDEALIADEKFEQQALGVAIEMCAQHFYGIETDITMKMSDVISNIRAIDEDLMFGK
jgi:hypothetical protein